MGTGKGGSVECVCGHTHRLTPTAMVLVIEAYQDGRGQTMPAPYEPRARCILEIVGEAPINGIRPDRIRAT